MERDGHTVSSYKVHLMDEEPKTREMIEMDFPNHAYTNPTYDRVNPVEFTYKSKIKMPFLIKLTLSTSTIKLLKCGPSEVCRHQKHHHTNRRLYVACRHSAY